MVAEIALAIATLVHFSLTAVQTRGVVATGFVVPVLFVLGATTLGLRRNSEGIVGSLVVLSIPFSAVAVISLLIFGAVTLGS